MADKTIDELVAASTVGDNDLLVLQQSGTAKKLSGKKLGDYVYAAAAEKVAEVETAVAGAQAAINQLEAQKNTIAQTVASMAQLGTDTTLTTSGMAADSKAVGDKFLNSLVNYKQVNTYSSCDDIEKDSIIAVGSTGGQTSIPDFPYPRAGWIWTIVWTDNLKMQIVFPWAPADDCDILYRIKNFNGWFPWLPIRIGAYDYVRRSMESNLNGALFLHRNIPNPSVSYYGVTLTYDKKREMYHASGSVTSGHDYVSYNIAVSDYNINSLGLVPGKRYNFLLEVSPTDTAWTDIVTRSSVKAALYLNYSTSSAKWTFITKFDANTLYKYIMPSNAVGFLIRAEFYPGYTFNHDYALHVTEEPVVSPGMIRSYIEQYAFSIRNSTPIPYNSSCDDVATCGSIFNSVSGSNATFRDFPFSEPGWLITIPDYSYGHMVQFAIGWNSRSIKYRSSKFNVYGDWLTLGDSAGSILSSCDVSTVKAPGFYLLADSQTYTSTPDNRGTGFLQTLEASGWTTQLFYGLRDNKVWKRTLEGNGTIGTWMLIGGGARDVIQNTYNITTSPTITSSTNGWLAAIDDETTTESNATDMTGAIMSMLTDTGYCHLGPGIFYVSGSIDMPYGSTLEGCGEKTIVRLLSSVSSGYIVRPFQRSTIRGIKFSGGSSIPTNLFTDGSDLGSRHGIYCHGNADGEGSTEPVFDNCIITDCWFENFDGSAFYAYNTGGGISQGVMMTDCFIIHSRVGINIDYFFEYAKFTSCIVKNCYYACINNGGNIVLTGCTFHGVVGMLCDNTDNDKRNNTHGSIIGCTFNHIDNMNHPELAGGGIAIHMINCANDEIITGCQFWYGNLLIENCVGVAFSDCLFGNNAITVTVTGSSPTFFFNNIFHNAPVLTVNSQSKFDRNYTKAGSLVEPI